MAAYTQDDGFHEIQLNGKQLVFLFMAATVVSVVIFLCGVLVGRGVRAERLLVADRNDALAEPTADHAAPPPAPPQPAADVTKVEAPPPVADELSATKTEHPAEEVKPDPPKAAATSVAAVARTSPDRAAPPKASEKNAPAETKAAPTPKTTPTARPTPAVAAAAAAPKPPPAPAAKDPTPPTAAAANSPTDGGYAVQVAAVPVRSEADAIAKRLASKGYATYVQAPASGGVFRVRIGSFKTRKEAETVAARLEKEEQIKPWITR